MVTTLCINNTVYYSKHLPSICTADHVLNNLSPNILSMFNVYHKNTISFSKSIFYHCKYLKRVMYCLF